MKSSTLVEQLSNLTKRQTEALRLLCEGKGYRTIAQELGISNSAVSGRVKRVSTKLGLEPLPLEKQREILLGLSCPEQTGNLTDHCELTQLQEEALMLLCEGKGYRTIAQELGISRDGVRSRIKRISRKLGLEALPSTKQRQILIELVCPSYIPRTEKQALPRIEPSVEDSLVRILNNEGDVVGLGFLFEHKRIITSAHVITASPKSLSDSLSLPTEIISLDFPMTKPDVRYKARVIAWEPEADLAVLELVDFPPIGVNPASVVISNDELKGHSFRALGFQAGTNNAVWTAGVLGAKLPGVSLQRIDEERSIGYKVQPGFSGSPVWDEDLGGVVGIISGIDHESGDSLVIPLREVPSFWLRTAPLPKRVKRPAKSERRKLKAFLCYAKEDNSKVRNLYNELSSDNIEPWMDKENLLPGQNWKLEIPEAIRSSDVVIIFLSKVAVKKTGYVQKEIKEAIEVSREQPEGVIFLRPARLDDCDVPQVLRDLHWADLFEHDGYQRLIAALKEREKTMV